MKLQYSISIFAVYFGTVVSVVTAGDICKNDGTLISFGLHPKCSCPAGFKGLDCSEKVTPCDGKPCRNAGMCSNNLDGTFTCTCPAFYEGILCERKVPKPCDNTPCQNGGICWNDGVKKFKCTCPSGYLGLVCDEKEAVYKSTVLDGHQEWINQLLKWLPSDQKGVMKLCYSTSKDGPDASTFHSLCDNKGPTVVLAKAGKYVFGGYASKSWGGDTHYMAANKSFIFSFVNKDGLKPFKSPLYRNFDKALRSDKIYLPVFGSGYDLVLGGRGSTSYANLGITYKLPEGYEPKSWAAGDLLGGEHNFNTSEVEVYYFLAAN